MRHAIAVPALLAIAVALLSCRRAPRAANMIAADLINEFSRAECRPANACETIRERDGPAVRVASPSRITWVLRLPHDARFETTISAPGDARVRFRIGVADQRTYEALAELVMTKADGRKPVAIDLSAYAGRKWSLFYHPDRIAWRLTLSADAVGGVPGVALWGAPRVMTTREGETEYRRRLGR